MDTLVKIRDLHKIYRRGERAHRRAPGRDARHPVGRLPRADGAVGLRQDDAAQPDRRPRHADRGLDRGGRRSHRQDVGGQAVGLARPAHRLRVPDVQPAPGPDGGEERRAAAAPDQARLRRSQAPRPDRSRRRRAGRTREALSAPAVGRTGAARRHRARHRHRSDAAAVRRADGRSRSQGRATRSWTCSRRSTAITARRS